MKEICTVILGLCITCTLYAQNPETDSVTVLEGVTIQAFEQHRSLQRSTASVAIITPKEIDRSSKTSLVPALNAIPGVRMEERSPGSYRINIRGSSLRSPFGIRNVKVYCNDMPLTDPGGNTYFNQLSPVHTTMIEVYKGPAASMYGAGTGGLILLNTFNQWKPGTRVELTTGSYQSMNMLATFMYGKQDRSKNIVTVAHNQSKGFRDHTNMRKDNVSWMAQYMLSKKREIHTSLLLANMYYQTPGALTAAEYEIAPRSSRPATGSLPSAIDAKASIYQKTAHAGFTHIYRFKDNVKNTTVLFGSMAHIRNPTFRNYEKRIEPSYGMRSTFAYNKKKVDRYNIQYVAGMEWQRGLFNNKVSTNKQGMADVLLTHDAIVYRASSFFLQADASLKNIWFISGGVSMNQTHVDITRKNIPIQLKQSRDYKNEMAPRLSIKRLVTNNYYIHATVARGFSPPTVAEVLPSTGIISTYLEAESGWNYELKAAAQSGNGKLHIDATVFNFKLHNALVQRRDSTGGDYFINSGTILQKGVELHLDYAYMPKEILVKKILFNLNYTRNFFTYGDFTKGTIDYTGKKIPSIPGHTFSLHADFSFVKDWYTYLSIYSASRIYLNDLNTAWATPYNLISLKAGRKIFMTNKLSIGLFAGVDNLLNEKYSLGNDINATGGRYYNAAPARNYYAGLSLNWD